MALAAVTPILLSANPAVPANALKELIARAKSKSTSLNVATPGTGASTHLVGAMPQSRSHGGPRPGESWKLPQRSMKTGCSRRLRV